MTAKKIAYLVFDCESVADRDLIAKVRFSGQDIDPHEAMEQYRSELIARTGSDFIPHTYQMPISVAVAKVDAKYRLLDLVVLDEPEYRPHIITENFWRGWDKYGQPTFVTFNGRSFDVPLMELAAFRFGISVPGWFRDQCRTWEQPRNRYNSSAHLDLQDLLVNYGATRFSGGLNLATQLVAKPGKMDVQGDMVQEMYDAGDLAGINDYCRCDVLDTYFVFLRTRVMTGKLALDEEEQLVADSKEWLIERADDSPAYQAYLERWNEWVNPWREEAVRS